MKDLRHTLTLKGQQFTPEFRQLINAAAEREGLTQSEWVFLALSRAAGVEPMSSSAERTSPTPDTIHKDTSRLLARRSGIGLTATLEQDEISEAITMFLGLNGFGSAPEDVTLSHTTQDGVTLFCAEVRQVTILDL